MTSIFLQARVKSVRLPQKALLKILGKSIIELIVERVQSIRDLDGIVLVTGPKDKNEELVKEAERIGIPYFCGSEENVLDRFYQASRMFQPGAIIRITGDCPLIDPRIIEEGIRIFQKERHDIVGNTRVRSYPDGMDFEVFGADALARAWNALRNVPEGTFVHPTKYMLQDPAFKARDMVHEPNLSHIRLTVDYKEDFSLIQKIYDRLYSEKPNFSLRDIMRFLSENPHLLDGNRKYTVLDYGLKK